MKVLIIDINIDGRLNTLEQVASGACALTEAFDCLMIGDFNEQAVDQASQIEGLKKITVCKASSEKGFLSEPWANFCAQWIKKEGYDCILAAQNTKSKDFIPHLAMYFDATSMTDIIEIVDNKTFKRPIYAGNAIEVIEFSGKYLLLTLRPQAFEKRALVEKKAEVVHLEANIESQKTEWIGEIKSQSDKVDLLSADIVVSGGRGVGSKEDFVLIERLADTLGAAIGASRAAVDAGYITNDYQVGQTGKIIAPELYFAIGISGAIQHLAGMKDSRIIIAINKDPDAQIFKVADYGLVGDLFTVVPKLTDLIEEKKKK